MSDMIALDATDRADAVRLAPWAQYVVESSVGWLAFGTLEAFQSWTRRRNWQDHA